MLCYATIFLEQSSIYTRQSIEHFTLIYRDYTLDDVLEDFIFLETTIASLKSLEFKNHFGLSLASPRNVQIQFK